MHKIAVELYRSSHSKSNAHVMYRYPRKVKYSNKELVLRYFL